jgi:hypothetical protein
MSRNNFLANCIECVEPTIQMIDCVNALPSTSAQKEPQQNQHHWSRQAIVILIEQYKEHQKDFINTAIKNDKLWGMITDKLAENNLIYTKSQIENKFKYLKARYVKKKTTKAAKEQENLH